MTWPMNDDERDTALSESRASEEEIAALPPCEACGEVIRPGEDTRFLGAVMHASCKRRIEADMKEVDRMRILNEFLEAGGTGPTPPELLKDDPQAGPDLKELLRQREAQREAADRSERIRQGMDEGLGGWR